MDRRSLERLGHHVVSRRVALGFRNRTDLADSLQFTVRTLADIEHGIRKASPGTYAMLENKLAWAPGSIETILAGGEPTELVSTLRRTTPNSPPHGYALRPTNPNALAHVPTEELLLELRRRIIDPRDRRTDAWDEWGGPDSRGDSGALIRKAFGPKRADAGLPLSRHRRPDHIEIVIVDAKNPEAKFVPPAALVLDEVEMLDQRPDRRLRAGQEVDVAPPRMDVVGHLPLVGLIVDHLARSR